jgi:hypothetical protein
MIMKKTILLLLLSCLYNLSNAQLYLEIGEDVYYCNQLDTLWMGQSVKVSGGTNPYSYEWTLLPYDTAYYEISKKINNETVFTNKFYASDILDDTTSANPRITISFLEGIKPPLRFNLAVKDSNGITATGIVSYKLNPVLGRPCELPVYQVKIKLGDSVQIEDQLGDFYFAEQHADELTARWVARNDSAATFSNKFNSTTWIKPTKSTYVGVNYINKYCSDSEFGGCTVYEIEVEDESSVKLIDNLSGFKLYPNPTEGLVTLEVSDEVLQSISKAEVVVFDIRGKELYRNKISKNSQIIDLKDFRKGAYIYRVKGRNLVRPVTGKLILR